MNLLVLGGTAWLGGEVARTATAAGHDVTCLARGVSGTAPDGVRVQPGDRDQPGALDAVRARDWDLVVDVSRQPGQVRRAAEALSDRARHYVLVSTGNVYANHSMPGSDERAPLLEPLDTDAMTSPDDYGRAKVACEVHVVAAFGPDRCLLARSGLIAGPGDATGRTGYWPLRFARPSNPSGAVLVPDAGGLFTQLIDVRDLAGWLVEAGSAGVAGPVDAVGEPTPLADVVQIARHVAGHDGPLATASDAWLVDRGVAEWMGERSLPLWLTDPDWRGFAARSGARARALGLLPRLLDRTFADTLAWELAHGADRPRAAGLSDADERALLVELGAIDAT